MVQIWVVPIKWHGRRLLFIYLSSEAKSNPIFVLVKLNKIIGPDITSLKRKYL